MNGTKAAWFGISGVVLFVATTILAAMLFPGYSHVSQLISESYAIDTAYSLQLRLLGFMPAGICIAVFAFTAIKVLPKNALTKTAFLGIGIFYGLATVVVSIFPCDKGCNKELIDPSFSQLIHNLMGLLTYLIVPACVILIGIAARKWSNAKYVFYTCIVCGIIAVLFVGILSGDMDSKFAGLYQRIIEGAVLAGIVVCSFYLKTAKVF